MKLTRLFNEFFNSEKRSGVILVLVTILSLVLANSPLQSEYINLWHVEAGGESIIHWINDALMAVFFLMIGLELEREIYIGELSGIKKASLPVIAAIGGMLLPAGIYLLFNFGKNTQAGAGIPMATDIAFAVGILSLLGRRVPASLKIFLTALAVIDDLGVILVIAIFYTTSIAFISLFISLGIFGFLLILNWLKVHNLIPYLVGGVFMWYFMLHSGIHPTIAGVLLAFTIPFGDGNEKSASPILQHILHKPVAYVILPLFAMANTCIPLGDHWFTGFTHANSIGIMAGLVIGKPLGIWLFSFIGVSLGVCVLPKDLRWKNIFGASLLGGIGFTISIFITMLAFESADLINSSKISILAASLLAGMIGFFFLNRTLKSPVEKNETG
jgi:Na+:H+ antiporter, NhaA family